MKRRKGYPIIYFCIIIILLVGMFSIKYFKKEVRTTNNYTSVVDTELKPIQKSINGIAVSIDPRIEMLVAVQLICGNERVIGTLTQLDSKYKEDVKNHFLKFSEHPAVKTYNIMVNSGFVYNYPSEAVISLTNLPELAKNIEFDKDVIQRAGGKMWLDRFAAQLKDFAQETKFVDFYNKNRSYYESVLEKNIKTLENTNYIKDIEEYYGMKRNSYNIILSPLFLNGGYGIKIKNQEGNYDVYSIQGPSLVESDMPNFGAREKFRYLAWHEFSHSFVNPLTAKNLVEVNKYSTLFTPIGEIMTKSAYPKWEICVNEHIVRAVTLRLTYINEGKEAYEEKLNYERSVGFFYVERLAEKLEEYENNRGRYKNLEEFYPQLIKVFKELNEKKLGDEFFKLKYYGPINFMFQMNESIVVIVPTNEEDKKVQEKILKDVKDLYTNNEDKIRIITDEEALKADLSDKNLMVYGTIDGNLLLRKYSADFPFKIEKNKITADKDYVGNDLRLITGLKSPINKDNGMIIYTAQRAEDIPDINNVYHGPTDYVIAEGEKVIVDGNYIKKGINWGFK